MRTPPTFRPAKTGRSSTPKVLLGTFDPSSPGVPQATGLIPRSTKYACRLLTSHWERYRGLRARNPSLLGNRRSSSYTYRRSHRDLTQTPADWHLGSRWESRPPTVQT